jgi:hypothetical protein
MAAPVVSEAVMLGRPSEWVPAPASGRCACGALVADHLTTFGGRCYLVKNERTVKLAGVRTIAGTAVRR